MSILSNEMKNGLNGSRKKYSQESVNIAIKNIQKVAPTLLDRECLEKMVQNGMLDYEHFNEAINVYEACAATMDAESVNENFLGDDFPANKFDANLIKDLALQKVKVDAVLEIAKNKDTMMANTIYDVINQLEEITKQAMKKYGPELDIVMGDISTMLNNEEEVNFINNIRNTQVRTYLNDETSGDKKFHGSGMDKESVNMEKKKKSELEKKEKEKKKKIEIEKKEKEKKKK